MACGGVDDRMRYSVTMLEMDTNHLHFSVDPRPISGGESISCIVDVRSGRCRWYNHISTASESAQSSRSLRSRSGNFVFTGVCVTVN